MLQIDHALVADGFVGKVAKGAVVEDVAVLVHLNEGRSLVRCGALEDGGQVRGIGVERPGGEGGFRCQRHTDGVQGVLIVPIGDDFVVLPSSDVGEYWPFVSP